MTEVTTGALSHDQVLDAMGETQRGVRVEPLPTSYYPTKIAVLGLKPSAQAGTPGFELLLPVTDGPYRGEEVPQFDSTLWLTPGKPDSKRPGSQAGLLNHMTHQVTGKRPDTSAWQQFGFMFTSAEHVNREFAEQFAGLDPDAKCAFMAQYCRTAEWDGKPVIMCVERQEPEAMRNALGEERLNDLGEPIMIVRNRVTNFYVLGHDRYGLAYCKNVAFPKQEQLRAAELAALTGAGE